MSGIVETKTAGKSRPWYRPEKKWRSANGEPVVDDARRDKHQQLGLVGGRGVVAEQEPDVGQLAEDRDARDVGAVRLLVDPADHHGATVLDQHLGLHVLGVDRD